MTTEVKERATMTVRETADYMGVSLNHVYNMLAEGTIPSRKLGRIYIISKKWVENYVQNGETTPITQR
jgi:excisionase family DNA binding protein